MKQSKSGASTGDLDIKAPDGFLLGGRRLVRKDATIIFQGTRWIAPEAWIGEKIWVHVADCWGNGAEAAPPGQCIYQAQGSNSTISLVQEKASMDGQILMEDLSDKIPLSPGFYAEREFKSRVCKIFAESGPMRGKLLGVLPESAVSAWYEDAKRVQRPNELKEA